MNKKAREKIDDMTLTQLENFDWGEPRIDSSIVKRCFRLRHKKIGSMSLDDLRTLVLQQIGLEFLIPKVIDLLKENPLAIADYYAGDLFHAVLSINPDFYDINPKYRVAVLGILESARSGYGELKDYERNISVEAIEEAAVKFLAKQA